MRYTRWLLYRPHSNKAPRNNQWISSYHYEAVNFYPFYTEGELQHWWSNSPRDSPAGLGTGPAPPASPSNPRCFKQHGVSVSDAGSQHRVVWTLQKEKRSQNALHSLKSEFTGRVRELFYLLPLWTPGMESISISLKHHLFQFNRKLLFNEIQGC